MINSLFLTASDSDLLLMSWQTSNQETDLLGVLLRDTVGHLFLLDLLSLLVFVFSLEVSWKRAAQCT